MIRSLACALATSLLVCLAFGQCEMRILNVRMCDDQGNAHTPQLGDTLYIVRVDCQVKGTPAAAYSVRFDLADQTKYKKGLIGTGSQDWQMEFYAPLDGEIPIRVEIDPDHVSGNTAKDAQVYTGSFKPIPPARPIEYYAVKQRFPKQTCALTVRDGTDFEDLSLYMAQAESDTFQKVLDHKTTEGAEDMTLPVTFDHIYKWSVPKDFKGTFKASQQYSILSSNVRCNIPDDAAAWDDLKHLRANERFYLKPEPGVQSDSDEVKQYVSGVLGDDYQAKYTPVEAARALYCAIAKDIEYKEPSWINARTTLRRKTGDCGGMSSLYVACLRSIGIPARIVLGWMAADRHAWSEMYCPSIGWIPQDVTFCNAISRSGKYAYYFSVNPVLNERFAVAKGSYFQLDDALVNVIQVGAVVQHGAKKRIGFSSTTEMMDGWR